MAELNLQQISDQLNKEFTGDTRKLIFWYDDNAEFAEDIDQLVLTNAKVYRLEKENQFYTKYFLERVDITTNYLIYAPFPKPDVRENHLEDTLLYSKRFFADRASLLVVNLGIDEKYKQVLEDHIKFFANKERSQRFYDLAIDHYDESTILIGIMSAICRAKTCSFEEVVRIVLTEGTLEENKFLAEFEKYGLLKPFWTYCEQNFGYSEGAPTLERLVVTMFVSYAAKYIDAELPDGWRMFISTKPGNNIAFLDNLMNNTLYADAFNALSKHVAEGLNAQAVLSGLPSEAIVECNTFLEVDMILVAWIMERLLAEDTDTKLNDLSISELCEKRSKMHFGAKTAKVYGLLKSAAALVDVADYQVGGNFRAVFTQYLTTDYKIDQEYRNFYHLYDQLDEPQDFEALRDLVEKIYSNEYLAAQLPAWNTGIQEEEALADISLEREFYDNHVRFVKERTVVIISDAMRYEVGYELLARLRDNPKCTAVLSTQLSVLPSYTRLGMAALLPHKTLTMTDQYQVLVDGMPCDSLEARQKVLQQYEPQSVCIQYDDIKGKKVDELRDILTHRQVIYVYHNQIDARGDKANTENEVFQACEEAIDEIIYLINRCSTSGNTYHFIVTADHGFLYKRDKLTESDKISGVNSADAFANRRFVVAQQPIIDNGVDHMRMGQILANDDGKFVSYPISSNVFKVAGGGLNYVHGGSSPQEMIVPVLKVKMQRGHMDTKKAAIDVLDMKKKITSLNARMDFLQMEPVSDVVKSAKYRIFFISEDGEKISGENTFNADSRDPSTQNRIVRLHFSFKNEAYSASKKYYLVVYDDESGIEQWRKSVVIDIPLANDWGFNI